MFVENGPAVLLSRAFGGENEMGILIFYKYIALLELKFRNRIKRHLIGWNDAYHLVECLPLSRTGYGELEIARGMELEF